MTDTSNDEYIIRLRPDEALVLSDWLDRVLATAEFASVVDDRAVWVPLHKIAGVLEFEYSGGLRPPLFRAAFVSPRPARS